MSVIRGKDVWLYFKDSDGFLKALSCSTECALITDTDTEETATRNTGVWKTYRGMRNGWRVTSSGLVSFDEETDGGVKLMTVTALREKYQFVFAECFIQFTATDGNKTETYSGYIIVTNIDTNAANSDNYKYSMQAIGNGKLLITDLPFDPNELNAKLMRLDYDGTGAETNGTTLPHFTELDGMSILTITRDGWDYRLVTSNPVGRQFTFNLIDPESPESETNYKQIVFAEDLPPISEGEPISIYYQTE